jgi:hypothetical protein
VPRPLRSATVPFAIAAALAGCAYHASPPGTAPGDASGGHAPPHFDAGLACTSWKEAVGPGGDAARKHDSFPELDPARSCFVAVRYGPGGPRPDPVPSGCGYPRGDAELVAIAERAAEYERIAEGAATAPIPMELACALPDEVRRAAARANARALRALADRIAGRPAYPYASVSTFGFGHREQGASALLSFRPGDACPQIDEHEMALLGVNVERARRAAEAYAAGVAPVITVSGGAVHSPLYEAFMLDYLLTCTLGVPATAVLVDPCADHTHTNIRNTGALVRALGGRTAYLVTDDGIQADYLEEWTWFDVAGGSIDQRSLRDFGYLLGSFRRASIGLHGGYWYTPYRFWAEPETGLGGFTCIR